MKILVVINLYPPHALGGYEYSCQDVVRRWQANGHDVSVLTTTTRFGEIADAATEVGVHRDLEWYWSDHEIRRPSAYARLRLERRNRRRLTQVLNQLRPDVVSLWAMGGMSMSLVSQCIDRGQSTAVVIEDDWLTYGPKIDAWVAAWSRRPTWQRTVGAILSGVPTRVPSLPASVPVAFASQWLQRRAAEAGLVTVSTSTVTPLGIDLTDFPLRGIDERSWRGRLLCVGRVEERKGFEVAVRALAALPDTTLRIAGPSDGHLDALLTIANELGVADRVTSGAVPRAQLAAVYREADALIFPSRWEEPFGLVPLEAMTQATPVVATRQGGSAEFLVDGENCLAIPVDDVDAVVAAVTRLAAEAALRRRLAVAGLKTAAAYDVQRFADGLEIVHLSAARMAT
jgi:glycosyltransferase involved in cell wall biosynthesis